MSLLFFSGSSISKDKIKKKQGSRHILSIKYKNSKGVYEEGDIEVEEMFGKIILGGDMVLGDAIDFHNKTGAFSDSLVLSLAGGSSSSSGTGSLWPQSIVPYTFDSSYSASQKEIVEDAIEYMEGNFGVDFVYRTNQSNYVHFTYIVDVDDFAAGRSKVGMVGGKQSIWLKDSSGFNQRTIVHEALHALGYYHEHQRSDRDNYIVVNWTNLDDCTSSFSIANYIDTDKAYDVNSIMHYGSYTSSDSCVFDTSEPMFTKVGGGTVSSSWSLSDTDTELLIEDYGYGQGTDITWYSYLCYGQGKLSWDAIEDAQYYIIQYQASSSGYWYTLDTTTSTSKTYLASNGIQENSYLKVIGINSLGQKSATSNIETARYYSGCL